MNMLRLLAAGLAVCGGGALALAEYHPAMVRTLTEAPPAASSQNAVTEPGVQPALKAKDRVSATATEEAPPAEVALQQRVANLEQAQLRLQAQLADAIRLIADSTDLDDAVVPAVFPQGADPWTMQQAQQVELAADAEQRFGQESTDLALEANLAARFGQMRSELTDSPFAAIDVTALDCRETVCKATVTADDEAAASALDHVLSSYVGELGYIAAVTPLSETVTVATISLH